MKNYSIRMVTDSYHVDGNWIENDGYWTKKTAMITDDTTKKDIVKYLHSIGLLYTSDLRSISVIDDGEMIEINKRNGQPILYLVEDVPF